MQRGCGDSLLPHETTNAKKNDEESSPRIPAKTVPPTDPSVCALVLLTEGN